MAGSRRKKGAEGFNTPFRDLAKQVAEQHGAVAEPEPEAASPAPQEAVPPPPGEGELFLQEMAGVEPLARGSGGRVRREARPRSPHPPRDDEAEAYAQLCDLVHREGPFDIADTQEHIEGIAPGLDRRLLKRLRRGDYAVQGHVDLHGLTSDVAKETVERFITASRTAGKRCVLIVHGRGLNSKDHIPVLKERLRLWLNRGRIGRAVLCFATARPYDGGAGAVYVLLRR